MLLNIAPYRDTLLSHQRIHTGHLQDQRPLFETVSTRCDNFRETRRLNESHRLIEQWTGIMAPL